MPMSVVYYCMDGEILAENRGGTVTHLIPDTLGNVIETRDSAGTKTSDTTYWPYGEVRTQTGTNPTALGYVGIRGYRKDVGTLYYVRARYLMTNLGSWLTVDSLWPTENPLNYAYNSPVDFIDKDGTKPEKGQPIIIREKPVRPGWPLLQLNRKCSISVCNYHNIGIIGVEPWSQHSYICGSEIGTRQPRQARKCSLGSHLGGIWSDFGKNDTCDTRYVGKQIVICKTVETDCSVFDELCKCIYQNENFEQPYLLCHWTTEEMLKCARRAAATKRGVYKPPKPGRHH